MKPKHEVPPWLKPKKPGASTDVGVGWYTEEEWSKVKAAAVDAERFEATYAEWLQMAEEALRELGASGISVEKTYIKAQELLAWCLVRNKANNGAARAEFVSQQRAKAGRNRL